MGFGLGIGVGDGDAGFVPVGEGVADGVGAGVTANTTGYWAAASVPVGSVKLIVPT